MGALINAGHRRRVLDYVRIGQEEGARLIAGDEPLPERGYFVRPTIFVDVRNDMRIAQEEIFGPVGMIIPFDSIDEAVQIANDSEFALSTTIWTRDLTNAHRIAARVT